MEVRAHLRHLRVAPRKVRLVVDLVRGLPVDRAIDQLTILPKGAALPVLKLLNSAIANAEHNFKLERKGLHIKSIVANEGPRLKRFRPRAFGRAAEILKRSSHITIILDDGSTVPHRTAPGKKPTAIKMAAADVKGAPAEPKTSPSIIKPVSTSLAEVHRAKDATIRRQGKE